MRRLLLLVGGLTTAWALVALPAEATYNARTTADEPQYLLSAMSLAEDLDLDVSDEIRARAYTPFHLAYLDQQTEPTADGREFSPHDPLLPVVLAAPMAVGGWAAAKATLALLAGVLAALLVWVAVTRLAVDGRGATVVVLAFALSAPLTSYGTQVYPELPAALAVTVGLAALTGSLDRRGRWLLVAAVVALPWLSVKYAPVALALVGVAAVRLWRAGERRDLLEGATVLAVMGVAYLVVHQLVWGGWTVYAAGDHFQEAGELSVSGLDPDYLGRTQRLLGLLVDRGFGLAAWAPVYLTAVPALGALVRRRPPWWAAVVVPLAVGWANATWVALTMHGWWWPGRQTVVVLPCLVLVTAWWAGRGRWRVPSIAALGALGVLTWGWLVAEVLAGHRRLIIDVEATTNPWFRAWRQVLPDLRVETAATPWLFAAWLIAVGALALWGWRTEAPPGVQREGVSTSIGQVGPGAAARRSSVVNNTTPSTSASAT